MDEGLGFVAGLENMGCNAAASERFAEL